MRKMPRRAKRETGDPITAPNQRVRFQMKKIDVLANSEMFDAAAFFHYQARGKDEGNPDSAARMNLEPELLLEKTPPHAPREQNTYEHHDFFHDLISS